MVPTPTEHQSDYFHHNNRGSVKLSVSGEKFSAITLGKETRHEVRIGLFEG